MLELTGFTSDAAPVVKAVIVNSAGGHDRGRLPELPEHRPQRHEQARARDRHRHERHGDGAAEHPDRDGHQVEVQRTGMVRVALGARVGGSGRRLPEQRRAARADVEAAQAHERGVAGRASIRAGSGSRPRSAPAATAAVSARAQRRSVRSRSRSRWTGRRRAAGVASSSGAAPVRRVRPAVSGTTGEGASPATTLPIGCTVDVRRRRLAAEVCWLPGGRSPSSQDSPSLPARATIRRCRDQRTTGGRSVGDPGVGRTAGLQRGRQPRRADPGDHGGAARRRAHLRGGRRRRRQHRRHVRPHAGAVRSRRRAP